MTVGSRSSENDRKILGRNWRESLDNPARNTRNGICNNKAIKFEGIEEAVDLPEDLSKTPYFARRNGRVEFLNGGGIRHHDPTIGEMVEARIRQDFGKAVIFTDALGHAFLHKVRGEMLGNPQDLNQYRSWMLQLDEVGRQKLAKLLENEEMVKGVREVIQNRQKMFKIG